MVVATAPVCTRTTQQPVQLINRPVCIVQQRLCTLPLPAEALSCCRVFLQRWPRQVLQAA